MSWKRVVQKIYKCDLNNLSSITTLWFIVLLITLQEEVITHIMNVYIMLLMCDVTISWVLKLVRFFQLQILLITYCCQFLALQKLAIWLPNCDCVHPTSENILFEQEYWCKCTDEIIFKLIFFVLISCTPRHFLFEIKWKCVCLSITCFFQRESLMLRISIFIFIARIQCRDWRNFLNFKVHLNGNRGETWVLHQEQQY